MVAVMSLVCKSIKYIYPNTYAKNRNSKQWLDLLVADKCLNAQSLILARLLPET